MGAWAFLRIRHAVRHLQAFTFAPGFGTLQRDINSTLPGGAANPNFGKLYADAAPATGEALNNQADYTANFFGNYSFSTTRLKGLSLGGGASFVGRRIIGNQVTNAFYIKAPATTPRPPPPATRSSCGTATCACSST